MPWSISGFSRKKRWFHSPWPWVGLAAFIGLCFLALPYVQKTYHALAEQRRMRRGEAAMQAGDYRRAMINAQIVLARNPKSIPANKLAARALDALKSPEVVQIRRRLDLLTGDPENALTLAEDYLKLGDQVAAGRVLESLSTEHRATARYHAIAARVAQVNRDGAGAEKQWEEAARLEPANSEYQLELARRRVASNSPEIRAAAAESLVQLAENPERRLPALRALLANAAAFRETSRTREFADRLVAEPEATFADRVSRLAVLHAMVPLEYPAYLGELQKQALEKPENVYLLLSWMNSNNQALLIPDWEPSLPAAAVALPQVKAALAEAYARGSAWAKLKQRIESEEWQELEFLRHAYIARADDRLDDEVGSMAAWTNAVSIAQEKPKRLEMLARSCYAWGWTRRGDDVLWKLAPTRFCPRWAADRLWAASLKARDAAKMYDAARLILKSDPTGVAARNNYIALALITGQTADKPHELALALYQQEPANPVVGTTYGLSLLQQNRTWEAVAVMHTFPEAELQKQPVSFYHGLFLAAAGEKAAAEPYLARGSANTILPEEQALLARYTQSAIPAVVVGAIDRMRTDTLAMYKEARQHFLDDSQSVRARSNYILLALLVRQNVDSARQLVRPLHKEQPQDPEVTIAYGYSLYDDRPDEAVAAMAALPPAELEEPVRAAYYGLFLAAAGQTDKATKYLDLGEKAALLPEEKAFLAKARTFPPKAK